MLLQGTAKLDAFSLSSGSASGYCCAGEIVFERGRSSAWRQAAGPRAGVG